MLRTCSSCGANNRIPPKHLADRGKCGRCKAELRPLAEPYAVPDVATFDAIIAGAKVPVLVDFWAARSLAGRALVLKVDTEALGALAQRYRTTSIPMFMVFRGGRTVFQQAGAVREADLLHYVEQPPPAAGVM